MTPEAHRLLDIGKGEPDFHTPDHIKLAACAAIAENFTKYTPQSGIPELREAIAGKFQRENGLRVTPEQVVVSCGGKHSIDNVIRALLKPGDEALIMTPHWFAYPGQVRLAGASPVFVPTHECDGFLPNPEQVRAAITPKARLMILNSPANPTGAVYSLELLEELAHIAIDHNLTVLADEVYEKLLYDGTRHVSIASLNEDIAARTVTINSVSKTHAMTGWRIGYAALPGELAEHIVAIQRLSTSAPSAISQRAALAALTGDQSHVESMVASYAERRALVLDRIERIPVLTAARPAGTFYCFVNISACLGRFIRGCSITNADGFSELLERHVRVKVVSGMAFGAPEHIRISFAVPADDLDAAFCRIEELIS
jgi:aspartate aminotransferase